MTLPSALETLIWRSATRSRMNWRPSQFGAADWICAWDQTSGSRPTRAIAESEQRESDRVSVMPSSYR
jgi:hypothetical protein